MKISELTTDIIAEYIRLDEDEADNDVVLYSVLDSSKQYIMSFTGLTYEQIDTMEDLTIACLALCQDFYDTRALNIPANKAARNKTVTDILEMHRVNFL